MKLERKITILPHTAKDFIIPWNGKFDMNRAMMYGGLMAGECYESEGFDKLVNENPSKTINRGNRTAISEHYTTHEHIHIGLEIVNFSKFVAMTLNNERQLVTSEKSARYTEIKPEIDSKISKEEAHLYEKWLNIFKKLITERYTNKFTENEIQKKAQENARYMVTSFASTRMIHTVNLAQLNRVSSFMEDFCNNVTSNNNATDFDKKLAKDYEEFIYHLNSLGLLDERLQSNKKNRKLSIFSDREVENYFGDTYSISYKGSIAQYAQTHRHRTVEHSMILDTKNHQFYIPEILRDNEDLVFEWLNDINSIANTYPQGKLVTINERGTIESLISKAYERRCAQAQLEIDRQTSLNLSIAAKKLEEKNHPMAQKVKSLALNPRCLNNYNCNNKNCKFPGSKDNARLI